MALKPTLPEQLTDPITSHVMLLSVGISILPDYTATIPRDSTNLAC